MLLTELDDDVLIYILSYLTPSEILSTRKICKRLHILSHLRIVWTNTCLNYIIQREIPFPNIPLESLTLEKLEAYAIHSTRLEAKWLSNDHAPTRKWFIDATMNTSVTDVRLLPGSEGTLLCTLSKSVWSAITIWELDPVITKKGDPRFRKCCQWSPRGAIVTKFALNSCSTSEATLAVSVSNNGHQAVELLSLKRSPESEMSLYSMMSMPSTFKPVKLDGDLLVLCDDIDETIVLNWRMGTYATLKSSEEENNSIWQHDNCIHVVFAYQSVMVVRARSIHLFPFPVLKHEVEGILTYPSIARHSFGWIDGVSVTVRTQHPNLSPASSTNNEQENRVPLSLLIRADTDDPWSSDILSLQLYTLPPNPNYIPLEPSEPIESPINKLTPTDKMSIPYIFPPIMVANVESQKGAVRCTDIILGKQGTAMWVQPRDRSIVGLYWSPIPDDAPPTFMQQENMNESLVAVAFSGSLSKCSDMFGNNGGSSGEVEIKKMKGLKVSWNDRNNWTSIDYDEEVGRVVLGSSFGQIVVVDL